MNLSILMPWFPIVLAVGLGGRLLGKKRGFLLGLLCALFWVVLVQAAVGVRVWGVVWSAMMMLAGMGAIIAIGGWAGEIAEQQEIKGSEHREFAAPSEPASRGRLEAAVIESLDLFEGWLSEHGSDADPWARFGEFLRGVLHRCCQATHVRMHRVVEGGKELVPMGDFEEGDSRRKAGRPDAIQSVVLESGLSFVFQSDSGQPSRKPGDVALPVWCFCIRRLGRPVSLVTVFQFTGTRPNSSSELELIARIAGQMWLRLVEFQAARESIHIDPISGLRTRESFLQGAESAVQDSYKQGEPVALAVIAFEHLRELHDRGRWETADELLRASGAALRQKVRADDQVGRFDGSRFIILFRRVDAQLANLIALQILARLRVVCNDASRWGTSIQVRCGLAGTASDQPDLRTLIARAMSQWSRARREDHSICTDLETVQPVESAS